MTITYPSYNYYSSNEKLIYNFMKSNTDHLKMLFKFIK